MEGPQGPISYLVTNELFGTLMYCVPRPSTQTHAHLWSTVPFQVQIFACKILGMPFFVVVLSDLPSERLGDAKEREKCFRGVG